MTWAGKPENKPPSRISGLALQVLFSVMLCGSGWVVGRWAGAIVGAILVTVFLYVVGKTQN